MSVKNLVLVSPQMQVLIVYKCSIHILVYMIQYCTILELHTIRKCHSIRFAGIYL